MENNEVASEPTGAPVVVVKLGTGQEVVGKLLHDDETQIVLESPLIVHVGRTEKNSLGMTLVPFSFAGEQHQVSLSKLHIVAIMAADQQFATQYLANLQGLVVAGANEMPKVTL